MPTSKKRVKKENQDNVQVIVKNPVKTKTGKAIIIILSAGFILSVLASLIVVLVQVAQQ